MHCGKTHPQTNRHNNVRPLSHKVKCSCSVQRIRTNMNIWLQWCRKREYRRTPKSFDLRKIREKSLKIREKSVEIWAKSVKTFAKYLKIRVKMVPNLVWIKKRHPTSAESHEVLFFGRSSLKKVYLKKCTHKKWPNNLLGKFGEIWAKILRTPKRISCSYTYVWLRDEHWTGLGLDWSGLQQIVFNLGWILLVNCFKILYPVSSEISDLRNFWLHTMYACTE